MIRFFRLKKLFFAFSFFLILSGICHAQSDFPSEASDFSSETSDFPSETSTESLPSVLQLPDLFENKIENGLSVYLLEDLSTPLVRVEFVAKAGFSDQTAQNTGFFKLYAALFADTLNYPLENAECLSDASRFSLYLSPSELPDFFEKLAETAFNPHFADVQIKTALSSMKKQVLESAKDPASLINQAIDSRVFASAPWKHDSGIYPALFTGTTNAQARVILSNIGEKYYQPDNCGLFVSGNINESEVLSIIDDTFGRYYKGSYLPQTHLETEEKSPRKFVISSDDFSDEFIQTVFQWTSLSSTQADMAACIYNSNSSTWKNALVSDQRLNCVGSDYIYAASAEKSGSTRFIVQALLNAGKTSPLNQATDFLSVALNNFSNISTNEYYNAVSNLYYSYIEKTKSSAAFMETLAQYWVKMNVLGLTSSSLKDLFSEDLIRHLEQQPDSIIEKLSTEVPFQFVLINSKLYNKYASDFKKAGFAEINSKNASWWQTSLANAVKVYEEKPLSQNISTSDWWWDFYNKNLEKQNVLQLKNSIPLYTIENAGATSRLIFKIKGGSLLSAQNPGFEEVMINLLAASVNKHLAEKQAQYIISSNYDIYAETNLTSSSIFIEFNQSDLQQVIKSFYDALVFSDFYPSDADRIVTSIQTKNRLRKGSTVNQLYSGLIEEISPETDLSKVSNPADEILSDISFQKILEAYPGLLNAGRFEIIFEGNSPSQAFAVLDQYMGTLQIINKIDEPEPAQINLPQKDKIRLKVLHTFLTDVAAKDAGPQPAILVPTKEFTDPIIYAFFPDASKTNENIDGKNLSPFNAVLYYAAHRLQRELNLLNLGECSVSVSAATENIPLGAIIVTNVSHTKTVDQALKTVLAQIAQELTVLMDFEKTTREIKNTWTKSFFPNGKSHAELKAQNNHYLDDYITVHCLTNEDFLWVLNNFFSDKTFTVYSADATY